jgi:hypothetical protein
MRTHGASLVTAALALVTIASRGFAAGPPALELDGCVRPSDGCAAVRDVVKLDDGKRKLEMAVEAIRLPLTPRASPQKVLTELKLRGLLVNGPDEVLRKLQPGTHVRVRGALITGPRLLLQGVDPLPEKSR